MPEQQEVPQRSQGRQQQKMKGMNDMNMIDPKGLAGYNAGVEVGRLHRGLGLIEFARTKEILLAELGYEVHLFDLAETHIRMAKEAEKACHLADAVVADARSIPRGDGTADAILLFGPLYHIVEWEERARCLAECRRLLKPGGKLFTANITCFSTALKYTELYDCRPAFDDDAVYDMVAATVRTGLHRGDEIGLVYFHRPEELRREVADAGFVDVDLRGVIGPAWIIRNLDEVWDDLVKREAILRIVRLLEKEESLMGFSTHFLSISTKA